MQPDQYENIPFLKELSVAAGALTRTTIEIDIPDVKAEVEAAFADYERALVEQRRRRARPALPRSPTTIRYGGAENLYGYAEIAAFRAARSPKGLSRKLERTVVTTYGRDFAIASTLFRRDSAPGKVGRQMQTWVARRTAGGSPPRMSASSTTRAERTMAGGFPTRSSS